MYAIHWPGWARTESLHEIFTIWLLCRRQWRAPYPQHDRIESGSLVIQALAYGVVPYCTGMVGIAGSSWL